MKGRRHFALIFAAGCVLLAESQAPAAAADLGGSDLEERIAELEATTVRKGNRKVSLELSGQVDKALLIWDDGLQSDAFVVDNNYSSTRFRLRGSANAAPGLKAGFYMEYEFRDRSSNLMDQSGFDNRGDENALRIRQENVWLETQYGRVTLGFQSMATKDLVLTNLGGGMNDPENYYAAAFKVRDVTLGDTLHAGGGALADASRLTWNNLSNALDAQRKEGVRYDTPSIYGFIASVFWGENDQWDIALRFQREWNSVRFAAGIGYAWYGDPFNNRNPTGLTNDQTLNDVNIPATGPNSKIGVISGNFSALHVPTGLYVTFSAATRDIENPANYLVDDATMYYVQVGVTKRVFDVGATTIYGEYGNYEDFATGARYNGSLSGPTRWVAGSSVDRFGVGFTQAFDSAALELYANYVHYSADLDTVDALGFRTFNAPEDFDAVVTGARLKF